MCFAVGLFPKNDDATNSCTAYVYAFACVRRTHTVSPVRPFGTSLRNLAFHPCCSFGPVTQ